MKDIRDLRQSLAAKCVAVVLLALSCAGAALGSVALMMLSESYGVAASFQQDMLCRETMEQALYYAEDAVAWQNGYSISQLSHYGGFSAQVYDGDPADGVLVGGWLEAPEEVLCQQSLRVLYGDEDYYTIVGCLSADIPSGSVFAMKRTVYNILHDLSFAGTVALTVSMYTISLALLVFLLCAAGHRTGRMGITLNWHDRIPLDLYLLAAATAFVIAMSTIDGLGHNAPAVMRAGLFIIVALIAWGIVLAALLTMATRLKKGKWWRNTICWRLLRWCNRLWLAIWHDVRELIRLLPLTWRTVLAVLAVLGLQSVLTLLFLESYGSIFFFLLAAAMDIALVVGVAWLSLQLQRIRDMGAALAAGDLDAKLDTDRMYWDVKCHAEDLNAIGVGMNRAVEQRLRSERLKTELITNVSHDIKTPLTSIVNYVDLLKKEELPPAAQEYLAVLDRQSHRLKKLTEDLVEASKASTGSIAVQLEPIVVNEIIHQAIGDYDEKLAAGKLEVIVNTYEGNLMALADGRLLWRVLDNLLSNVCKYAMAGTRVYVDLSTRDGKVFLSIKNISRDPLNISADELMERFVRGDASRHTEGSGLGLNIARSLMDLMGGGFALSVDGDLFKAELTLRA